MVPASYHLLQWYQHPLTCCNGTGILSPAAMVPASYHLLQWYDERGYLHPESIRASLGLTPPYVREGGGVLPKRLELMLCKPCLISNWAFRSFTPHLKLGGIEREVHLHIPIIDFKAPFPVAVAFWAHKGKLAVMYGASKKDLNLKQLLDAGAPLRDSISPSMFKA
eukprot:gene32490-17736_t